MDDRDRLPATPDAPPQRGLERYRGGGGGALSLDLLDDRREADPDEIDLLAYWRILVKRKWLVLGVLGTVVALALIATLMMPPIYRATAVMQIDRESVQILQVEGTGSAEAGSNSPCGGAEG